ncbi:hypothetical protein ES288_A07G246000v1 [Gossypium darwinii]|uniref:Uncharacterized protein n=1 Tax=Gossypium darwinii TaxID=34276 RepID=A0A5D2FZA0_GOSDA|nr:hypothetical protein ES288_A07G246000v1 [Gossypium darwinii]
MAGGRRHSTEFPICAVEAYSEGLNFWKGSRGENKTFGPSRARIRRRQRTIAGQSKGRFSGRGQVAEVIDGGGRCKWGTRVSVSETLV